MNGWPFSRTPQLLRKQIETPNYVCTYADKLGVVVISLLSAVAALPARSWFELRASVCVFVGRTATTARCIYNP